MKQLTKNRLIIGLIGLTLISGSISSCRKKADTIAIIHVYDQTNHAVANAQVKLIGTSTNGSSSAVREPKVATTDASGNATFNYNDIYQLGQCGVAVFDIEASNGTLSGTGIIKVEQETTSEETVFLQ
jgi:hypothetical protein